MTDRHDDELRDYLQSRIPAPGPGYWDSIDARLRGEEPPSRPVDVAGSASSDERHVESSDTDASVIRPMGMNKTNSLGSPRILLLAAALIVIAGLGAVALLNRADDEPVGVATASDDPADDGATSEDGATNKEDGDQRGEDSAATSSDEPVQAEPASPEEAAELNALMDASPLMAVQSRLNGAFDTPAGPYCFSHPDSYVFPADELADRRALLQLDVGGDGFVNFTAMQGETIVITGSGYPDEAGTLLTTPIAEVGASGAPPYEIQIGDAQISVAPSEAPLDLVDCDDPEIFDRLNTMFVLLTDPTASWVFDAWPPDDAVLSSAGLGPIRIGMSVSELSAELGVDLSIETIDGNVAGACGSVAATTSIARDVWILVELTSPEDGIIRRVSTFSGPWFTPSGITVGSTQQDVIETFPGQIEESSHVYVDGTYMRYLPTNADDPNTVEFVNEDGIIAEIRVGDRDWVGLVEGCA